ncbi:hypothetical protein FLONG3_7891 [Fusarium longipes]|uniref:2EXR domain-containing protein n=1 Tax=Fusarium longipes TaxID=694270 RepID=A0A395SAJ4_9HYPO|nr:hypothetical protein FLONG3_7891 [Fusarium longipes]
MAPPTFHCFPKLPPELRIKIWKAACFHRTDKDHGIHYVSVDTVVESGEDEDIVLFDDNLQGFDDEFYMEHDQNGYITLRALSRTNGQNQDNHPKQSAYLWDAGLWSACKESRNAIIKHMDLDGWLKLRDESQQDLDEDMSGWYTQSFPSTLVPHERDKEWRPFTVPRQDIFCITGRPSALQYSLFGLKLLAPLLGTPTFTIVENWKVAFKFDNSWNHNFPLKLDDLMQEGSKRGLLANWVDEVRLGGYDVDAYYLPSLWIIDDTSPWAALPGLEPETVYHDCGAEYVRCHWGDIRGHAFDHGESPVEQFINSFAALMDNYEDSSYMLFPTEAELHINLLVHKENRVPDDCRSATETESDEFGEVSL